MERKRGTCGRNGGASAGGASGEGVPETGAGPGPLRECDRWFLARLREAVMARIDDPACDVPGLARAVGLSARQLQRRCRDLSGQGPLEFVRAVRMSEAFEWVRRGTYRTVAEVAAAVGMSPSYFARLYGARYGRAPSEDLRA